ncbi:hypothetical protein [Brevundimonas lenta]|uniref:Cell envelope biogenesis protein TolA n=1 Tax=Brevundimonas lenta TaxID=424796 RepID=A0A7W6JFR1_9CAUL|nr:hypothetical protein [Brevundimonas lenta]MBB4084294.1 hypothetical protein [Brevundimonas lenta]
MAPRLKVFTWSDGFHAFTVAAGSRPKALAAWGIKRDIFTDGLAHELEEGPDYDAALADPGQVIERGVAIDIDKVSRRPSPKKKAGPSHAAREKVRALEAELHDLDQTQAEARADLEAEAQRIAAELNAMTKAHDRERDRLTARLKQARAKVQDA